MTITPIPYSGLYTIIEEKEQLIPLKHTEVNAKISGNISRVQVKQTFTNPFNQALEATYVFPLPDEAAVDKMEIKIGDRLIQGNIKKKEQAQQIYRQAKQQGRTAGLLEQQRDNIFRQSLANIRPKEDIEIIIYYTDSLKFWGGDYEFVFPMVVGPRYMPGTLIDRSGDTDEVPDASKITPPISLSGHDIQVTVDIVVGFPITKVESPSHSIETQNTKKGLRVNLSLIDNIPNKDLIIKYTVAKEITQITGLTQKDAQGGHFALYLIPALAYKPEEIAPKDLVLLIDTSGSQRGAPIEQCKRLMRKLVEGLNPYDTFSIIDFSNTTRKLSPTPLGNTANNQARAINYINQLTANGGTELLRGVQEVLRFPQPSLGRLRSIILLTDGYIGNEKAVLAEVEEKLKPGNRLYSFGAGSSVNRFLLNRIAEVGRGFSQIIRHDEPINEVVENFYHKMNNPVLTNIEAIWQGSGIAPMIYPQTPPDLFSNQPLVLFGRKQDSLPGVLTIRGNLGTGEVYQQSFSVNFDEFDNPAISQLWGRARIKELTSQMYQYPDSKLVEEVTNTALSYQLLSEYTAFVAVSDDVRVNPYQTGLSAEVPVNMPEGVNMRSPAPLSVVHDNDVTIILDELILDDRFSAPVFTEEDCDSEDLAISELNSDLFDIGLDAQRNNQYETLDDDNDNWSDIIGLFDEAASRKSYQKLRILETPNLDSESVKILTQKLQSIDLSRTIQGKLVFQIKINQGRVQSVTVNKEDSTITDTSTIKQLIKKIILCRFSQSVNVSGVLALELQ